MMQAIKSQFGHPRGLLGRIVGKILAAENRERIEWTVRKLKPQPDDHILEIGFGPGVSIEFLAQHVQQGQIAGVDISDVMVEQATKRNQVAVQAGRVDLRVGTATDLPYEARSFDTVLAINSLHHWGDVSRGLQNVYRVLKPGGQVVIVEQPPTRPDEAQMRQRGAEIERLLQQTGFTYTEATYATLQRGVVAYICGVK